MAEQSPARLAALDGLRGFASLQVFVYHYFVRVLPPDVEDPTRLLAMVQRCATQLFSGVDLFFVLSGFLITRILLSVKHADRYFSTFYIRRACRILPLYFVVLGSYLVAVPTGGVARWPDLLATTLPTWPFAVFLQNFWMASAGSFGAIWLAGTWSLAVEEQFYLFLPLIVRRLSLRWLTIFTVAAIVAAPITRMALQAAGGYPLAGYVLIFARCDSLAWGSLLAIALKADSPWLARASRWFPAAAGTSALAALILGARLLPSFERFAFVDRSLLAVTYGLVLAWVLTTPAGWLSRTLSRPTMKAFGDMAYANYLLHPIVLGVVIVAITGHAPALRTPFDLAATVVAALVAIALSAASWRLFERPIVRIGQSFAYESAVAPGVRSQLATGIR